MEVIYVLRLAHGKWYVGRTKDIQLRFIQHLAGNGSEWTRKHEPIEIVAELPMIDMFEEDKQVKISMQKYGIDNVRGGSYVQLQIAADVRAVLERELASSADKCFNCNQAGHYVGGCPHPAQAKVQTQAIAMPVPHGDPNVFNAARMRAEAQSQNRFDPQSIMFCFQCKQTGHARPHCPNGPQQQRKSTASAPASSDVCYECGELGHRKPDCPRLARQQQQRKPTASAPASSDVCYECGELGHWKPDCPRLARQQQQRKSTASAPASSDVCYECGDVGHWKPDCPRLATTEPLNYKRPYQRQSPLGPAVTPRQRVEVPVTPVTPVVRRSSSTSTTPTCYGCGGMGHYRPNCPSTVEQEARGIVCFYCGGAGHVQPNCPTKMNDECGSESEDDEEEEEEEEEPYPYPRRRRFR